MQCPNCRRALADTDLICKCGQIILRLNGLFPKQRKVLDLIRARGESAPTLIGAGGSRGSAKSRVGRDVALTVAFEVAQELPGIVINIMRRNWPDLEENMIEKFKLERPQLAQFYHGGRQSFEFPRSMGGARITFTYADHIDDVVRISRGPEFFLLIVDQAEQFSERELNELNTPNRWPGAARGACKSLYLFNPAGEDGRAAIGAQYLRRIFFLRQFRENENPNAYAFVPMYSWENWAWFSAESIAVDGETLTKDKFFGLPGDDPPPLGNHEKYDNAWLADVDPRHRFRIFVTQTTEGRKMWGKPASIRMGDLFGRFDQFAGQYFNEVWDERLCVLSPGQIARVADDWWTCWMSGDWGFGHNWTQFWFVIGKISPQRAWEALQIDTEWPLEIIIVYRELIPPTRTAEAEVAQMIVDATPDPERKEIVKWVMGSDVNKAPRFAPHTIHEMIENVTVPAGLPKIRNAQDGPGSRVVNARIMWEMLRRTTSMRGEKPPKDKPDEKTYPLLFVSSECPALISAIPALMADPDSPADVLKVDGVADDVFDGVKYGLAEYAAVRLVAPVHVRRTEYVERATSPQGQYINRLKFDHDEKFRGVRGKKR